MSENPYIIIARNNQLKTNLFNRKYKVWAETIEQAKAKVIKELKDIVIISGYLETEYTKDRFLL